MGQGYILYAVVNAHGKLRRRGDTRAAATGSFMVYDSLAVAKRQCRDGDSVVQLELDLDRQPLFIKGQVLDGEA